MACAHRQYPSCSFGEIGFAAEEGQEFATLLDASAVLALGEAALHTANQAQSRFCTSIAQRMIEVGVPEVRRQAHWLLALQQMSRPAGSVERNQLLALATASLLSIVPTFSVDAVDSIRIIRIAIAIAIGDGGLEDEGLALALERVRRNPGVPSMAAALVQVRGLINGDSREFADAAAGFASVARPVAQASALEDLGRALARHGNRTDGVEQLSRSLQTYSDCGATWDAGRVRGRLRALGVRPRLVRPATPSGARDGLTESERKVADLVGQGLTNREVAERLSISPHTASMHLRQVFAKLEINSRIELIRIASAGERADD